MVKTLLMLAGSLLVPVPGAGVVAFVGIMWSRRRRKLASQKTAS